MTEEALSQLPRLSRSPAAVGHGQVVEYQQLSGLQIDGDFDVVEAKSVAPKELEFSREAVELQPAEKSRLDFDAGEERQAICCGSLDNSRQASLDVATVVVPGAMRSTIGGKPLDQLAGGRPTALTQQRDQRHQSGNRLDARDLQRNIQRAVPGHVLLDLRIERQPEVEVQGLKIPGFPTVQRRDDKVADGGERGKAAVDPALLDQRAGDPVGLAVGSEWASDPRESAGSQCRSRAQHGHRLGGHNWQRSRTPMVSKVTVGWPGDGGTSGLRATCARDRAR